MLRASLVAQLVKNPPAMQETSVLQDPLEKGQATNPSILGLPWRLRWQRIHLQCRRPRFDPWVGKMPRKRAWQRTPIFLPEESPRTEEPGGLQSTGLQRVRHGWATKHSTVYVASSFYFYVFTYQPLHGACRILVPQPGMNPCPLLLKRRVLTTGPPGKYPFLLFKGTNPLMGAPLSSPHLNLIISQKPHHEITSYGGLGLQPLDLGWVWDTDIQFGVKKIMRYSWAGIKFII